jgi:hypothetical protein
MYLKDNPTLMTEVEEKVKGILGIRAASPEEESSADE